MINGEQEHNNNKYLLIQDLLDPINYKLRDNLQIGKDLIPINQQIWDVFAEKY